MRRARRSPIASSCSSTRWRTRRNGKLVEQFDRNDLSDVRRIKFSQRVEFGMPFCFELAEAVASASEDRAGVVVMGLEGSDEAVLTVGDLLEGTARCVDLGSVLGDSAVVEPAEEAGGALSRPPSPRAAGG